MLGAQANSNFETILLQQSNVGSVALILVAIVR
jgi:hypothetical protein